jgi:hypothetical protein
LVALAAGRDGLGAEVRAERIDCDGGVDVLVGVDADDDLGGRGFAHAGNLQAG